MKMGGHGTFENLSLGTKVEKFFSLDLIPCGGASISGNKLIQLHVLSLSIAIAA